jgi:tRNA(Ile)-lysidine synthase
MASSRKPPSAERIAVALSGGVDSVVLLHSLRGRPGVFAVHVHHGLSPNADQWARFCTRLCKQWRVPLRVRRVKVAKRGKGLEAAAREARYAVFRKIRCDMLALAHNLDDQAETVLMNLLRGAGTRGASGMPRTARLAGKRLARPLLDVPRAAIVAYAERHGLEWIEDESNADESLTRNFVRRRLGPLIESRFPRWREALARAARHFAAKDLDARLLLREFLAARGLRAPSEAKLSEMLKQLTAQGSRTLIEHDGVRLRLFRGKVFVANEPAGEGDIRFRPARGKGIDAELAKKGFTVRQRSGGEKLQPDPRRPRRTLKNLFQEAGIAPWQRERLPLLYCGEDLVWVPGLGIDARYQAAKNAAGLVPSWSNSLFLRKSQPGRGKLLG